MSDTCDVCEEPAVQWNRDTFDGPVKRACRRHTETPENILQDLIAELRGYQEDRDATEWLMDSRGECLCDGESPEVDRCTLHNTRQVTSMADRAEARLHTARHADTHH